jgi:hypothetical protein
VGPVSQRERREGKVSWVARGLNGPSKLAGPRGEKEAGGLRLGEWARKVSRAEMRPAALVLLGLKERGGGWAGPKERREGEKRDLGFLSFSFFKLFFFKFKHYKPFFKIFKTF